MREPFVSLIHPVALACLLGTPPSPAIAQRPIGPLWNAYARGAEILRAAAAAHGGADRIRQLRAISYTWDGRYFDAEQGRTTQFADTAANARPAMYQLSIDYKTRRFELNGAFAFPGGYVDLASSARAPTNVRMVGDGKRFLFYDPSDRGSAYAYDTTGSAAAAQLNRFMSRAPLARLRRAIEALATVRYLGTVGRGGHTEDAVGFVDTDAHQYTLYVDRRTHLLSRIETLGDGASFGDMITTHAFSDYESVEGLQVPTRADEYQNGIHVGTFRRTAVAIDQALPDSLIDIPVGYSRQAPATPLAIRRIDQGVYVVEGIGGSYRSLVVDTDEGVVVFEAPVSVAESERAAALIERTLIGRTIRFVAVSHHHGDHIGGIGAYLPRGVSVLLAPSSVGYVRDRLADPHTVGKADLPAPRDRSADQLRPSPGRRMIGHGSAGTAAVEIIDVSPTSHTSAMLVAYVPSQKLLFAGDLLQVGGEHPLAASTRDLGDIINRFSLEVETIVPVHGPIASRAELSTALSGAARERR